MINVCLEMNVLNSGLFSSVMSQPFCCCRKRLEQQQKMLEEDRKRRQFEEQKQRLRLLSNVKPKVWPVSNQQSARRDKDREMSGFHQVHIHSSTGAVWLNVSVCSVWLFVLRLERKAATMPWRPSRATWMALAEMPRCTLLNHHRPKNKVCSWVFFLTEAALKVL